MSRRLRWDIKQLLNRRLTNGVGLALLAWWSGFVGWACSKGVGVLVCLAGAPSAFEMLAELVESKWCSNTLLVVFGATRHVLRVSIGIVRVVVRRAWLMAIGRSCGSYMLDSLLLLEKVRCYLVEPGFFSLHTYMAEIVSRPSSFIFRMGRAAVSVRRARWSGVFDEWWWAV